MQVKTIVVGLDGSEPAAAALDWTVAMAKGMGSEVVAVFAIAPMVYAFPEGYPMLPPQLDPEWRKLMQADFETVWCKPLKEAGIRYRTVMEDGSPASVLNEVADRVGADVVVVGRRGRGGIAELVLGSVSHALVLHSHHPVLLVPSSEHATSAAES